MANNTMYHLRDRSRDLVSVSGSTVKLFEDETEQILKTNQPQPPPSPQVSGLTIEIFVVRFRNGTNFKKQITPNLHPHLHLPTHPFNISTLLAGGKHNINVICGVVSSHESC